MIYPKPKDRGEITTTLTLAGLIVVVIGIVFGSRLVLLGQTAPSSINPSQSLSLPSHISTDGVHPGVGVLVLVGVLVGVLLGQTAPSSINPSQSLSLPSHISTDGVHPGVGVRVLVGVLVGVDVGRLLQIVLFTEGL